MKSNLQFGNFGPKISRLLGPVFAANGLRGLHVEVGGGVRKLRLEDLGAALQDVDGRVRISG
jgi:hypothetical protein